MIYFDYIVRLTCVCWVSIWQLYAIVSPRLYHETRLTYLYIDKVANLRITPNGSLFEFWGHAQKWAHPP